MFDVFMIIIRSVFVKRRAAVLANPRTLRYDKEQILMRKGGAEDAEARAGYP